MLRIEANFDDHELIRRYFDIPLGERLLVSKILDSPIPVLHNYFMDVVSPTLKLGKLPDIRGIAKTEKELLCAYGAATLYEECSRDMKLTKDKLITSFPKRSSPYRSSPKVEEALNAGIILSQRRRLGNDLRRINEIKDKLLK